MGVSPPVLVTMLSATNWQSMLCTSTRGTSAENPVVGRGVGREGQEATTVTHLPNPFVVRPPTRGGWEDAVRVGAKPHYVQCPAELDQPEEPKRLCTHWCAINATAMLIQ